MNELEEEYYKMMAFRYDFTNGVEYTKEQLDWYRDRFNSYYKFERDDTYIINMLVLKSEYFSVNEINYTEDSTGMKCINLELGYEKYLINKLAHDNFISVLNNYNSKLFNDFMKLSSSGLWLYINFKGEN